MLISAFSFAPSGMAIMNITLSSAGKVVCVAANSRLSVENVTFYESAYNSYYFRSDVPSVETFTLVHNPGVEQRAFCKAVCLLTPQHLTTYFVSEPFYTTCTYFTSP